MTRRRTCPLEASRRGRLAFFVAASLLTACSRPGTPALQEVGGTGHTKAAGAVVVARVGSRVITATQADAPLQLALHDLEMQQYRLRRQSLESEILRALRSGNEKQPIAEILLLPPVPPRLDIDADASRARPAAAAPVTLTVFCSFESPHCARLQITLSQVLPLFPGVVRYAERDLPLGFHRHAGKAAEAAHCAADQGRYWHFHDVLYATAGAPDRAVLDRAARTTNLDITRFDECLDSGRHATTVASDLAIARSLGLAVVPAVFVNGRYASPDVQPSDLVWLIESELAAGGVPSPRRIEATVESTMAARLRGLIASSQPGQGLALLSTSVAQDQVHAFREGDAVATGVVLRRITDRGIELLRDGRAEKLAWHAPARPAQPAAPTPDGSLYDSPHRAVPVTLDRSQVLTLLADSVALTAALQPVPMTTDGYRQLRVQTVAPGSLYELLGFLPGDVILSVNEQPLHEASNPLWVALEQDGEVRVRVIRRGGLAKHFTYRFGN